MSTTEKPRTLTPTLYVLALLAYARATIEKMEQTNRHTSAYEYSDGELVIVTGRGPWGDKLRNYVAQNRDVYQVGLENLDALKLTREEP